MSDLPTYVLDRVFDAPRELVWRAWTEPELFAHWYGPNVETVIHKLELEVGGQGLVEMRMGDGSHYQRLDYTEIIPPERLVCLMSHSDSDWNIIPFSMMPDWPRILLTTVTLEEDGAQTKMRLTWVPHEATEAEVTCFAGAMDGMGTGWGAGMELLAELLAELQA
ncbi:MAG: SRPBCC domain-containing protein [Chloroflexi bacterium]|nr:SRPBCC domain-containing protein [Chloroflexota bacterium]